MGQFGCWWGWSMASMSLPTSCSLVTCALSPDLVCMSCTSGKTYLCTCRLLLCICLRSWQGGLTVWLIVLVTAEKSVWLLFSLQPVNGNIWRAHYRLSPSWPWGKIRWYLLPSGMGFPSPYLLGHISCEKAGPPCSCCPRCVGCSHHSKSHGM